MIGAPSDVHQDILDNELVRKYFMPQYKAYYPCNDKTSQMDAAAWDRCALAANVLRAQQEPIRKGDLILNTHAIEGARLEPCTTDEFPTWHPYLLRLPDRFQEKKIVDMPDDFKLWGYSVNELREMRNYAESHGWRLAREKKA